MLQVQIEETNEGTLHVYLSGAVDETASFDVFERLDSDAVFNLRKIQRINSIGVNAWIRSFEPYTRRHSAVVEELSYALVMQANCVANLFGQAEVRSCLAPYFCSPCNETSMVLVTLDDLRQSDGETPQRACPKCKAELDFDELDEYFNFMRRTL